jgi:hypothetical protein
MEHLVPVATMMTAKDVVMDNFLMIPESLQRKEKLKALNVQLRS